MTHTITRRAYILSALLILITAAALISLCTASAKQSRSASAYTQTAYTAYIYQNGELIRSIPLSECTHREQFTVGSADTVYNTIQFSAAGIQIIDANCPDKHCVQQGLISDSRIPITCLPGRLVIELQPSDSKYGAGTDSIDAVTY